MIRRLAQRGVVQNQDAVVTSLVSQRQVQQAQIDQLVEKTFSGSLPQFIAAFTQGRRLSPDQAEEIQRMIDRYKEE